MAQAAASPTNSNQTNAWSQDLQVKKVKSNEKWMTRILRTASSQDRSMIFKYQKIMIKSWMMIDSVIIILKSLKI